MQKAAFRIGATYARHQYLTKRPIILAMKMTIFLLTAAFLNVSANGISQTVTYKGENVSLKVLLQVVKDQTGYVFFADDNLLEKTKPVSVHAENEELANFLKNIFKDQPLEYRIANKNIIIKPLRAAEQLSTPLLSPPPITVWGRIVNEKGEPVSASIIIKGTKRGTISDANGVFQINNVEENAILIISATNIETQEIKVNGRTEINIAAITKIASEEEVVINAGYYRVRNRDKTGNISRVDAKTIEKQPVSNALQALQGRMTGVQIIQNTGVPGGSFTIQIRGRNSLRFDGNQPLYLVDGLPYPGQNLGTNITITPINGGNPLSAINPSDIESIEVLKDADATAIYGSRGANGVVLITTRKGAAGKTKVDVNFYAGEGKVASKLEMMNTQQYLEMRHEAFRNDGMEPQFYDYDVNGAWDTTRYTDWQKELIGGTANITHSQVSVSGGNGNTQFLMSGTFHKETTVFPGDFSDQKGSGHFNLNHTSSNGKFIASLLVNYVSENNNLFQVDLARQSLTLSPNAPALYNADGTLNWENDTWINPLASLKQKYKATTDNLVSNANFGYQVVRGLVLKTNLGFSTTQFREMMITPVSSYPAYYGITSGSSNFAANNVKTWIIEPQAEYDVKIGRGSLTALIGSTFQQSNQERQLLSASGFTSDLLLENIKAASLVSVADYDYSQYRYNAIFGRIYYNWNEKYLINITGRRDGSSRFGPGKQFANFGAAGIGWIFSNEQFIKDRLGFLSFGKLRASYGTTGSDQIGNYQFLNTYSSGVPYLGVNTLRPVRLFNPDYAWETNKKLEVAAELGFLKDRILFSLSWYKNRSSNQLVGYPLSSVTGFPNIQYNLPATVQNTGWEFELKTYNIKNEEFAWSTYINLTMPRDKLISFPNIEGSSYATTYAVGKPLSIANKFHFTGVNPQTGVYTFEDVNGDGFASYPDDLQFLKTLGQRFYGGFQNIIRFKGIELDILFQFVKQINLNFLYQYEIPGSMANQPVFVLDRWQKPGDIAGVQRFSQDYSDAYFAFSDAKYYGDITVIDRSFVRLKNLSLSYQFPGDWLRKLKLQNARIYFQGQNLLTITDYIGWDPELGSLSIPPLKMFTAGIQFTL